MVNNYVFQQDLHISPDGVRIFIMWNKLKVGTSMFIPCINVDKCKVQVYAKGKSMGMKFKYAPRIEEGKWGLRVWRVM